MTLTITTQTVHISWAIWSGEHIVAGLSIAIFTIPGLLAYLIVVIAILRNPKTFAKKSYYSFLLILALCDILQTVNCLVYAVPCILLQKRIFGDSFDRYYNPIVTGILYYVGIGCIVLIAINRYIAVCRFSIYHRVFHNRRMRFYVLGVWLFGIYSAMWSWLPGFGYSFYPYWYTWGIDAVGWRADYLTWYDHVVAAILFSCLIFCYAAVIIKRPGKIDATDANSVDRVEQRKRERAERALALQFCLISAIFLIYNVVERIYGSPLFSLFQTLYYIVFLNCNPFIYFAFNSDIREHVLKMMGKTKKVTVITVTQSARSAWY